MADRLQRERLAAEQLTTLLVNMEVPPIDEAAHQRLQRLIYLYGPEHATERCCPVRPQAAT